MRITLLCSVLALLIFEDTSALHISFSSPPAAATTVSFEWTRESGDREDAWLRKQKLDDGPGMGLSDPFQSRGPNGPIRRPEDIGKWTTNATKTFTLTVLTNPTSAGAIQIPPTISAGTFPSSTTASPTSSNVSSPKPNISLIVGWSIAGTALLGIVVGVSIIFWRRRHSQQRRGSPIGIQSDANPALLTPYPPLGEISVAEKQLRRKEDDQSRELGETRAPDIEEQREERRIVRQEDSDMALLATSTNRRSSIVHLPPSYSEANFVR
ncbi:hypothetical protein PQX77_001339 [Marasmius sp. AFHP31]|nr:hypothetical protein PQX77_001339 [Marasmius sp. AFHP31]